MNNETDNSDQRSEWWTDVLIIGSGAAGLRAALAASENANVTLITKTTLKESNTLYAQGGIAVAMNVDDTVALHVEDTCSAGCGLCDISAVETMVSEGIPRVTELLDWGANFDWEGTLPRFTQEAAHSRKRIVHKGDATGRETTDVLVQRVLNTERIRVISNVFAVDLLTDETSITNDDKITCYGVTAIVEGKIVHLYAKATILATGGLGRLYPCTSNPEVATGDGFAAAWRAGCEMIDMEFVQFHPTTLYLDGAPNFLISEAVRGEGGKLVNIRGEQFMDKYHERGELAPRDVVSRAIQNEMLLTGFPCVYLDITHKSADFIHDRFPTISATTKHFGLDISIDLIPVRPGAHFMMGGVHTNSESETNIQGLYACGEVACTGVHGANRLASNSLLECLVFGVRAGNNAASYTATQTLKSPPILQLTYPKITEDNKKNEPLNKDTILSIKDAICETLWENVAIERDCEGLELTLSDLEEIEDEIGLCQSSPASIQTANVELCETVNMLNVAWIITKAALTRTESRGAHYRADFPDQDDNEWKRRIIITKDHEPEMIELPCSTNF
ncbi:L-aspartate oxidase [Candidatus Poribacteria bacterium]|nr:L-aspartate oxidase [Candidatus Poribacteria bacterium]